MNNIILIGPPGSGKSTVAKILSEKLGMPYYDIDDDHLEKIWNKSVGEVLAELGDDEFVKREGEALFSINKQNTIISLTGSNPLHEQSMKYIKTLGQLIYLDVDKSMIISRLEQMKVDRIVGMKTESMSNILDYRKGFYEKYYDIRVMFMKDGEKLAKAEKVLKSISLNQNYISTRGYFNENDDFLSVVLKGIAPDGGLFLPKDFIRLDENDLSMLAQYSYQERALRILEKFPIGNMNPQKLRSLLYDAYNRTNFESFKIVPIVPLNENQYLIEIFHGPTAAFKDVALQLVPKFFTEANEEQERINKGKGREKYLVLAATSGDTGVAAIEGYKNEPNVSVMVLYPKDGVSEVQKMQMLSSIGDNVTVVGIDGDFDFCQTTVKKIFNDKKLNEELLNEFGFKLNSANSINWGRLVPQVVYHISAYLDLVNIKKIKLGEEVDVCIPSGNFGNLLAAFIAGKMGIPFKRYICASNDNNVLTDFFNKGIYDVKNRKMIKTHSPSIDILKANNIERLLYLLSNGDCDLVRGYMEKLEKEGYFEVNDEIKEELKKSFVAGYCTDEDSLKTIKKTFDQTGILIDTHTAVAKKVADDYKEDRPMIIASTAHWSKFPHAMLKALGGDPEGKTVTELHNEIIKIAPGAYVHFKLNGIENKPILHNNICSADMNAIVDYMKEFLKKQ